MPTFDTAISVLLVWAIIGYLIGSIPFGLLVSRKMGLGDPRDIGSGNIGATNVLRTGSKKAAAATLFLDGAKGAAVVLLAKLLAGSDAMMVAALAAMIGHCFPVWLKFKGGKGVATFLGIMLAIGWPVGAACCVVWAVVAVFTRMSSMAALAAASASTFAIVFLGYGNMVVLGFLLTLLIFWRHRTNISRIKDGTEPKIGQKA